MTNTSPSLRHRDHAPALLRILGWLLLALVLGALAMMAEGQEPAVLEQTTTAPTPAPPHVVRQLDKAEFRLLLADAGIRTLDCYSTQRMLAQGNHEMLLPREIADRPWAMAGVEAADIAAQWWLERRLQRAGHARFAHWLTATDAAGDGFWAVRNFTLGRRGKAGLQLPVQPLPSPPTQPKIATN